MDRESSSSKGFAKCPECEYKLPHHANDCSIGKNVGRRSFLKALAASGALVGAGALGFGVGHATPSSNNSIIEPGSMAQPNDYVMYYDGTNWFGRNGTTGQNDPSIKSSDFYTAFVAAKAAGGLSFYVKPPSPWATIPLTTALPLSSGITIRGSLPQVSNVDPTAPENNTFTGGTVFSGSGIDAITGNSITSALIEDIGLSGFNSGFNFGTSANTLGIAKSCLRRIFYSNVLTPITVSNFQMLRLDQHYAWLPTTYFIKATNNNTNWNGGNSYWTDLFAHGCKNVNGAVQLLAIAGYLNFVECRRLQVNMQDSSFTNSTSGYGLYLQGQSATALCQNNTFYSVDLEGTPLKAVRLEDYAQTNFINIAFDNLSAGGFDFSLKKNLTTQAPVWNQLNILKAGNIAVESDSFNNFLYTSGQLVPPTGAYPAGISGFGGALFNGTNLPTIYGGNGQSVMAGTQVNYPGSAFTTPQTILTAQIPIAQQFEVAAEIIVTAFTSGAIQLQVTFTDILGNARTMIIPVNIIATGVAQPTGANAIGYWPSAPVKLSTAANSNIVVSTIGTFTATYHAGAIVRATA